MGPVFGLPRHHPPPGEGSAGAALLWVTQLCSFSQSFSAPKCGRGKPALVRRHTLEDRSALISCIENGNYAKAARIAAGESSMGPLWPVFPGGCARTDEGAAGVRPASSPELSRGPGLRPGSSWSLLGGHGDSDDVQG